MAQHHARDHHDAHGHHGEVHGTLPEYVVGFALSVILTAVPFWLVMDHVLKSNVHTALAVMAFAAAQMVVHMVCFLHMRPRAEGGWSFMALMFTVIVVVITLTGSLWVMYHLNTNMAPMPDMLQQP
jgi:cytochrome o ubiquinol oxidase operon protein cyoD